MTLIDFLKDNQLDFALVNAMQHASVQFVELLIEQGASFDRLRRLIVINDLYKKVRYTIKKQ